MLRKFLIAVLFMCAIMSAFADDECPAGYGYTLLVDAAVGGCVDLGSLPWWKNDTISGEFYTYAVTDLVGQSGNNLFINGYQSSRNGFNLAYGECSHAYSAQENNNYNVITIRDDKFSDSTVTDFQQAMSGVILYYQRETDESWVPPRDDTVCNIDTSSYEPYGEYVLPEIFGCTLCPPNTYKDTIGNTDCTPCPNGTMSPAGATSIDQCGRVLHIGGKVYHLNSVKKTSPAIHVRDENGKLWYGNLYSEE